MHWRINRHQSWLRQTRYLPMMNRSSGYQNQQIWWNRDQKILIKNQRPPAEHGSVAPSKGLPHTPYLCWWPLIFIANKDNLMLGKKIAALDRIYAVYDGYCTTLDMACQKYCAHCCTTNVTLTTLGYGEITPISSPARSFAVLEAMMGQIYLAVLIARLVGIHIAQSSRS